ncbi:MAG: hypothetical protein ACXABF_14210, partial [Candidatus Thorarchaeota archaeon]
MTRKLQLISVLVCCCIITFSLPQNSVNYDSKGLHNGFTVGDRDEWPTEEWRNSTPEEQGMSSEDLNSMMNLIEEQDIPIDSVIVTKHGYIVHEEYPST